MDEANLRTLEAVPDAGDFRLHPLLSLKELQEDTTTVDELLTDARAVLDAHEGSIDAIVGYRDFPVSTLVPLLSKEYKTTSTSLESVVKCEHKYWSRLEQRKVIDEHPRFGIVDLDSDDPRPPEGMSFPMWLKPALAYSSELAFGVGDMDEFRTAVAEIRGGIARVGKPFEAILDLLELPPEMAGVGGQVCLAEEAMTGIQVAVEGYAHQGEVTVYGVLDSINYPDSSSFLRHQYPSTLPAPVIQQLHDVSERTMRQIGMDDATFSIEFFYDPKTGDISLLEINPRHSQSHAEMFHFVDGVPNHHRMFRLALGGDPALPAGVLNLTHRESDEHPEPLEPGRRYRARITLNGVAQAFPPGHRIRLSLSTSYWPLVWPAPEPTLLTVHEDGAALTLPVRPTEEPDGMPQAPFGEPEGCRPPPVTRLTESEQAWNVSRSLVDYHSALDIMKDRGRQRYEDNGIEVGLRACERYTSVADDFASLSGRSSWTMTFSRPGGWDVRVENRKS
ncbi:CocE/NonD family hydrolase C-terminal non-catalytic domain-containing protein [Streptomyces cyaneofuscatus]|uniref:ATP-grasp domain-containing protein n=1 Tax=Streptomyces cyaneofuscatus TaxID=66883 RepID=UPI0033DBB094